MGKTEKPWTWEEIAKLHGKAAKAFMQTYGDRGVAALLASGHKPGTWKANCPYEGRPICVGIFSGGRECPMDDRSKWRKKHSHLPCSQVAMEVYALMVEKLGLLPEEVR
jgi:hypothetical protein